MMPQLNSSNIESAEYDDTKRVMTVTFKSGSTYEYDGVGREVYEGLVSSLSPGSYFYRQVKDRFPMRRIS